MARDLLLAEANLAWMRYPLDDPRMADMREEIDRINRLGDQSPGFVWRFKTASGDATDVRVLDDWRILFNLSIWRSIDDLRQYLYRTEHAAFLARRRDWFLRPPKDPVALWWVADGEYPDVEESLSRLEQLWREGPTPEAFTLTRAFGPDGSRLAHSDRRRDPATSKPR